MAVREAEGEAAPVRALTHSTFISGSPRINPVAESARWPWLDIAVRLLAVAIGALIVRAPLVGIGIAAIVMAIGLVFMDRLRFERCATLILVGGAMALGYGWANLGIPGPIPLPLTEMILIPLAVLAVLNPMTLIDKRVLVPLCLFALLVAIRLVFDYPVWGIYAVRDTTEAVEAFVLLIGYRAIVRDGISYWIKQMRYLAGIVLIWGTVYPLFPSLTAEAGPTVGLQRPTRLLDPTGVKFSVIAAGLYFVIFSKSWRIQLAVLGLMTGLLGIYQARTLFLMFPLSILFLGWATHRLGKSFALLMVALSLGVGLIAWAGAHGVLGDNHEVATLQYTAAEAATLIGHDGPHAATIDARTGFVRQDLALVFKSPWTAIAGVGLGPDLTFGQYIGHQGQLVRNPHNDYLEVFARLGIVGFVIWMLVLFWSIVPTLRAARSGDGQTERFCAWIVASAITYLGVAAAQPLLSFPYGSVPLFFLLGMGLAAAKQLRAKPHRAMPHNLVKAT